MGNELIHCQAVRERIELLSARCDSVPAGELAFHEHVAQCAACRKHYEDAREQIRLLNAWSTPEPPVNMEARVMAGIAQVERREREQQTRPTVLGQLIAMLARRYRVPAAAAATVAILLAASVCVNIALLLPGKDAGNEVAAQTTPQALTQVLPSRDAQALLETASRPGAQAVYQTGPARIGSFAQSGAAVPLGIIVILGAPPAVEPRVSSQSMGI